MTQKRSGFSADELIAETDEPARLGPVVSSEPDDDMDDNDSSGEGSFDDNAAMMLPLIPAYKTSRGANSDSIIAAYNNFVRRVIDCTLNRNITFCEQPRQAVNVLERICVKAWPQLEPKRHRNRIRAYLKACRRNAKKNFGHINMKDPPMNSLSPEVRKMVLEALQRTEKDVRNLKIMLHSRAESPLSKFERENSRLESTKLQMEGINDRLNFTVPVPPPASSSSPVCSTTPLLNSVMQPSPSVPLPATLAIQFLMSKMSHTPRAAPPVRPVQQPSRPAPFVPPVYHQMHNLIGRLIGSQPLQREDMDMYLNDSQLSSDLLRQTKNYLLLLLSKLNTVEEYLADNRRKNVTHSESAPSAANDSCHQAFGQVEENKLKSVYDFLAHLRANSQVGRSCNK